MTEYWHHSPKNSLIEIEISQTSEAVRISVTDEGPGIAKEHENRIFDRFYRIDKARTRDDHGGSGIGLSIVKWIGEIHGGQVQFERNHPVGSKFQITLPAV